MKENQSLRILGLVISDGVGYRNFVLSDFLSEASLIFDRVIIFSALPQDTFDLIQIANVEVVELPILKETSCIWFWRKLKEVTHLQRHKAFFGINENRLGSYSKDRTWRGLATRLIFFISSKWHSEGIIQFYETVQQKLISRHSVTKESAELLQYHAPDLLFFTHQRPPIVVPLFVAARKMKIPSGSFIFSWDNLSSKGRMAANFDFFLVWSELMKEELLQFYPQVLPQNIDTVGTPQFEPYNTIKYSVPFLDFVNDFNIDPKKKILLYSCGDFSTSKNDELYITKIALAIKGNKFIEEVNFVVRTSPAEEPGRFKSLKEKFPFIIWNYPDWPSGRRANTEEWSQKVPSAADISHLKALLKFSDIIINMCSTMSLDAIIFDKPVINPVFGNEENGLYNDQRFLNFDHYKRVVKSNAVTIAKNEKELLSAINIYLKTPELNSLERSKLLEAQIGKPLEGTGRRIAATLRGRI